MKKFTKILSIFIMGAAATFTYHSELLGNSSYRQHEAIVKLQDSNLEAKTDLPKIDLCFTPPKHCGHLIAQLIDAAQSSIYMQAYGLTHPEIIHSLIRAKQRGLEVRVLLDQSNKNQKYSKMKQLLTAGIEVNIDGVPGIAHNKVIIIDELKTITGSFNFTVSADTRNAENVLIIEDKAIAKSYLLNWLERKLLSE